jgi:hypothetical protein
MIVSHPASMKRDVVANRHQTWVRDAMDAVALRVRFRTRTNDANADAKSCGPGLPTLRPSLQRDERCERWEQESPVPRESAI